MKFVLMMHAPQGTGDWDIYNWKPEEIAAHTDYWKHLNEDLRKAGQLVEVVGLEPPKETRVVRAGKSGALEVSDGPFAESKEFLAGYWIVDVESAQQAYAIAGRASAAPGPGGAPLNMPLEVRKVLF